MHEIIKLVASYFIVIPVLGVGYLLVRLKRNKRWELVAELIMGGVLSLILAKLASKLYDDPRPFVQGHFTPLLAHGNDNGFPSDHTLLSAFIGWVCLRYSRKLGVGLLVVAALIGTARMAAGIHHSSDIVGSFVLAGLGAYTAIKLVALLQKRRRNQTKTT